MELIIAIYETALSSGPYDKAKVFATFMAIVPTFVAGCAVWHMTKTVASLFIRN